MKLGEFLDIEPCLLKWFCHILKQNSIKCTHSTIKSGLNYGINILNIAVDSEDIRKPKKPLFLNKFLVTIGVINLQKCSI